MGKIYNPESIRNVVLLGHVGSGKTTLNEALLLRANAIEKKGEIERGTTVSDYTDEEIKQKMSIRTSLSFIEWKDHKINLVDIPGSGDFSGEINPALRVAESCIVVIDAEFGIQIETEKHWQMANNFKRPRIVFINKIDKEMVDHKTLLEKIEHNFKEPPVVPIQIPMGNGKDFKGIIDVIYHKAYFRDEHGKIIEAEIPEEYYDEYRATRDRLKELVCEVDDSLTERFLEGGKFTDEEYIDALTKSILQYKVVPILFGTSIRDIGMGAVLDTIIRYMPSPSYVPVTDGTDLLTNEPATRSILGENNPFAAFVFKTTIDQYAGRISFFKVRSGSIKSGDEIYNSRTGKKEKVAHIYMARGKKQIESDTITAGDIGVLAKLSDCRTGDTISVPSSPFQFLPLKIPQPIYFTAIKILKNDVKALEVLDTIAQEDLTFNVEFDSETKETIIKAMGALQVKLALERVISLTKAEIEQSVPRVAYRETIRKQAQAQYRHKKQSGGSGQFGEVHLEVSPLPRDGGFEFVNDIFGGAIPKQYIPGVEKGIQDALAQGPLGRYPMVDIKVRLYDGKYHDVDSNELSFRIAGSMAAKEAFKNASPVLLEPVMKVTVYVPEEFTGSIMNELTGKRGKILGMEAASNTVQMIKAEVPLSEMLTYSIEMKASTSGRGTFEMEHSHYQELTGPLADKVIEERKALLGIAE
ncbi:elongation factor G [Brachyspira pulli]|uniref:elongation factor G n=1 Tax=Brachyspira pulli TaxID=310721 RepID=UPI003004A3C6